MTYIIGGLSAFCIGLVMLLYWYSQEHARKERERQRLFDEYENRRRAIINGCDIIIDNLPVKDLNTNEEVIGYLTHPNDFSN